VTLKDLQNAVEVLLEVEFLLAIATKTWTEMAILAKAATSVQSIVSLSAPDV